MYHLKYWILISLLALPLMAQQPKESHMRDSGKSNRQWVPFDAMPHDVSIWRDDGRDEYACEILDWNIMANPHPVLKIMVPPSTVYSLIRVAFKLSWKEKRPDYWMGINGVNKYTCRFRVKNDVFQVRLQVYK